LSEAYFLKALRPRYDKSESLVMKMPELLEKAGIKDMVAKDNVVAIKMHIGVIVGYRTIRPPFVRQVADKVVKGRYWLVEDFRGLTVESPVIHEAVKISELKVHSAPTELPSAQPTWTKESQSTHVSVVSQSLYEPYRSHCRTFLVNPVNGREARTALISIEAEVLSGYRERLSKTTSRVRAGEAMLIDRSYRDYLALGKNSLVRLVIY